MRMRMIEFEDGKSEKKVTYAVGFCSEVLEKCYSEYEYSEIKEAKKKLDELKKESPELRYELFKRTKTETIYALTDEYIDKQTQTTLEDGVTTCCGYDFGLDEYGDKKKQLKYCPMCGKKIRNNEE